jgi:hypothetical protein
MRKSLFLIPLALAAAFALGRATGPSPASASSAVHIYTGRGHDVFRVPSAAVRCLVSQEGRFSNVVCQHTPYWHFQIYFTKGWLAVLKRGYPDNPVFATRTP